MKKTTAIAVLLMLCLNGSAQVQAGIQPLRLGDTVPDVALQLVNHSKQKARLHDFTNKLLILEFWSPRCSTCAHEIAGLDSLQKRFKDSLCIILVNPAGAGDTKKSIRQFIKGYRQRIKDGFMLPCIVRDSVLSGLFPFETLSEFVWIHKGMYTAQTEPELVNTVNIYATIHGQTVQLKQKDKRSYYEAANTLKDYISSDMAVREVYPHLFEGHIKSLVPESGILRDKIKGNRLLVINGSVEELYALAWRAPAPLYKNIIINKAERKDLFAGINKRDTVIKQKIFSYEFISRETDDLMFKQMQADLRQYFNVIAKVETDTLLCLVLHAADTTKTLSKGGIEGNSLYEAIQGERFMYNQPLSTLTERLNELLDIPVTDETGIKQPVDLRLPNNLNDINMLQKMLGEQGILPQYARRPLKVFVLNTIQDTVLSQ